MLKLLQGKPSGLFTALDEQAMLGDRASDENWLGVVMGAHLGTNPRFSRPKIAPEDKFMVTHYASAVMCVHLVPLVSHPRHTRTHTHTRAHTHARNLN